MMPKKVEPLPCLCGEIPGVSHYSFWAVRCMNEHCLCKPHTKHYTRRFHAVDAWNRWIRAGIRRLAKVVEEE